MSQSTNIPTPPPPPSSGLPSRLSAQSQGGDSSTKSQDEVHFRVDKSNPDNIQFEFPKTSVSSETGSVSLRAVIGQYLGSTQSSRATAAKLHHILGRLRFLRYSLEKYNEGLIDESPEFVQYWRRHTLGLLSAFGYYPGQSKQGLLRIIGLDHLISELETISHDSIEEARHQISTGTLTFDALGELFYPGQLVKTSTILRATPCVFRVADSFYEERRTLFGSQMDFRVTLEMLVSLGDHFSVASFSEVFTSWRGARGRNLADFAYQPVSDIERSSLFIRGQKAVELASGGAKYLAYVPGTFFVHGTSRSHRGGSPMALGSRNAQSVTGGRIMVDMARGASSGHHPCQGVDEATLAIIQLAERYRLWLAKRPSSREAPMDTESMLVCDEVPEDFHIMCWPALVGFSFTAKVWGHVIVDGLSYINFHDHAFDRLVLSEERKQLVRAVTKRGAVSESQDLIGGKQGGLILLLHGPPGVGKTLTAEATAEVLRRPLYYVTMGELGVTPDDLERRLTDVLDLCAEWNAIAVLDEADVFLEKRSNSDLIRNAMVCVMLRIVEYHPGILFLTTNRVRTLDPAFESRITMAMRYKALDKEARIAIWRNQLEALSADLVSDGIDYDELAEEPLNGRQIKNTVRLSLGLATDQGSHLTQEILMKTIKMTSIGHMDMINDDEW